MRKYNEEQLKWLKKIKDLSNSERLRKLGLPTLEYRRRRADMIETLKLIHGIHKVNRNKVFFSHLTRIKQEDKNIKSSKNNVGLNID